MTDTTAPTYAIKGSSMTQGYNSSPGMVQLPTITANDLTGPITIAKLQNVIGAYHSSPYIHHTMELMQAVEKGRLNALEVAALTEVMDLFNIKYNSKLAKAMAETDNG